MAHKPDAEGPSFFAALGSLFGGGPKVVRPAFSAYGKLPLYKDFLRHGLAARESQAFRHWLDRGFSRHWDADEACHTHPIEPHAFTFRFEGLARRVVGCLWGSHDQGELRRFPFTLFVSIPVGGACGELAALAALGQVAEKARELRRSVREATDVQDFYRRVRETSLTLQIERDAVVRERLAREVGEIPVRELAGSLYGEAAPRLWPALLAYFERRRAAAQSRSRDGAQPPLACRLPVSKLLPVLQQAELWAALLQGTGAKSKAPLNMILPWGNEPTGGLVILERDLRPDDVFAFHPEPPAYEFVEDLRRAVPGASSEVPPPERWDQPLSILLEPGALGPAGG